MGYPPRGVLNVLAPAPTDCVPGDRTGGARIHLAGPTRRWYAPRVTQEEIKVEDNRVVALAYTLEDSEGAQLDEASAGEPLLYLHGHGNLMPGLEQALNGRGVGERFEVELAPDEAFGPRVEDAERTLPRDAFPDEVPLEAGLELALEDDAGEVIPFWVKEVTDDRVLIDLNHPFAGRTVRFAGEVVKIRDASADELEHGHPHGLEGDETH